MITGPKWAQIQFDQLLGWYLPGPLVDPPRKKKRVMRIKTSRPVHWNLTSEIRISPYIEFIRFEWLILQYKIHCPFIIIHYFYAAYIKKRRGFYYLVTESELIKRAFLFWHDINIPTILNHEHLTTLFNLDPVTNQTKWNSRSTTHTHTKSNQIKLCSHEQSTQSMSIERIGKVSCIDQLKFCLNWFQFYFA